MSDQYMFGRDLVLLYFFLLIGRDRHWLIRTMTTEGTLHANVFNNYIKQTTWW